MIFLLCWTLFFGLTDGTSVSVTCSAKQIDLLFLFDEPFFGVVSMKPKESCSVIGDGHPKLLLTLTLGDKTKQKCSVIQHNGFNIAVIDIGLHKELQTDQDISYLIRCPIMNPDKEQNKTEMEVPPEAKLKIFDKETRKKTKPAVVGKPYDMKFTIPEDKLGANLRIGQCIAFNAENDLKFLQLTDENGCSVAKEMPHEFREENNPTSSSLGNSSKLYLQCEIKRCNQMCPQIKCDKQSSTVGKTINDEQLQTSLAAAQVELVNMARTEYCDSIFNNIGIMWGLTIFLAICTTAVWYIAFTKNRGNLNDILIEIEFRKYFEKIKSKTIDLIKRMKILVRQQREDICMHSPFSDYTKPVPQVTTNNMVLKTTTCYLQDVKAPIFDVITIPPPNLLPPDDMNCLYQLDNLPDPPKLSILRKSEFSEEKLIVEDIGTLELATEETSEETKEIKVDSHTTQSCNSTLDRPLKSALKKS
ncbi:hypothetical protein FO519_001099, partial [Halicephalobus sp. NKZ332]